MNFLFCISFIAAIYLYIPSFGAKKDIENASYHFPELSEAQGLITKKSPQFLNHLQKIREAKGRNLMAKSGSGIKLGINLQGQSVYEDRPSQRYLQKYRAFSSAYLRKPLFHWGALQAEEEISEMNERFSRQSLDFLKQSLIINAESDYLAIVLLNFQKDLAIETLNIAKNNEAEQVKRKELGLVTDLTINESKTQRIHQEIIVIDLQNSLTLRKKLFNQSIGEDSNFTFEIAKEFISFCKNHSFDLPIPILVSQLHSHELNRLQKESESEKKRITIAESKLKPKFNLFGGFFQDQIPVADNRDIINRNNFVIGVEADWALWDSSLSKGEKMVAQSRLQQREIEIELHIQKERIELENLRSYLSSLSQSIIARRGLVEAAEDRYERSVIEFSRNRIKPDLYFQSRIALDTSRLSLMDVIFKFLKTRSAYFHRIKQ